MKVTFAMPIILVIIWCSLHTVNGSPWSPPGQCVIEGEASMCGKPGHYGVCRTGGCRSGEKVGHYDKSDCLGGDCHCCKPAERPPAPNTSIGCMREESPCEGPGGPEHFGTCRTHGCRSGERVSSTPWNSKSVCPGKDCQCCKPKWKTPIECVLEEFQCGTPGNYGVCRTLGCRAGEEVSSSESKSHCPGRDCLCCKPQMPPAPNSAIGCMREESQCGGPWDYGVCRTLGCKYGEMVSRSSKSDCPGKECQCCKFMDM